MKELGAKVYIHKNVQVIVLYTHKVLYDKDLQIFSIWSIEKYSF